MSFPATDKDARAAGYTFLYPTTCLACGAKIRFFRTPQYIHIAVNAGPKFERHNCLTARKAK